MKIMGRQHTMKKYKTNHLFLLFILIISNTWSACQHISKEKVTNNEINIIKAYQIPISGGAPGSKGTKIALILTKKKDVIFDSLAYNGKVKSLSNVKAQQDTLWLESHFYHREERARGKEFVENRKTEKFCDLYYHIKGTSKKYHIPQLELKQSTTLWY